ncbi:hypothetical protein Thein_0767 [Thermodesulfatator indicus DSM 15286]|uniref:Uncharacterized protein n=1 Tax=Thermodesulfatator indicus (strain DSM 15286 / JCM 11887 / CIR29812) TaxID=667014 RepID=F8ACE4_THEID|nr:hypothetical protein [Thermodesulfatator indicus]AEH44645.1 hypothetical protein Thein_0767 [Thermodesulfatator indicus DSM 15286]
MARVAIEKALNWSLSQCKDLDVGECIDLLCKKRNRIVRVIKVEDAFLVEERGFFNEDHVARDLKDLQKILARLIAREFPRSHILWAFKRRA